MDFYADPHAVTRGTSLKGYLTASYTDLVEAFGQPHFDEGDKVSTEWMFGDTDGNTYTLYDWQPCAGSMGPSRSMVDCVPNYEWHVGGRGSANDFIRWAQGQLARARERS